MYRADRHKKSIFVSKNPHVEIVSMRIDVLDILFKGNSVFG